LDIYYFLIFENLNQNLEIWIHAQSVHTLALGFSS